VHEVSLQLPDLPAVALMAVLMRGVGQPRALQVVFAAVLLVATAQGTCVPCATAPRAQSFRAPYPRFSAPPPPLSLLLSLPTHIGVTTLLRPAD
jgi:hypothetical protein